MDLRFVSWNIHARGQLAPLLALLKDISPDIIALQEVTTWGYQQLVASSLFSWSAFSLDIRPPQSGEGRGRQLGCAILGRTPFRLQCAYTLEHAPLPERMLIVEVETP